MTPDDLKELALCGETTRVQYKSEFTGETKIAAEMVAFANTHGGVILFGVMDKTGELLGLTYEQLQQTNLELGNTATDQVKPAIYIETEVVKVEDKRFLACHVAEGRNKPYKTNNGEIWVKQGSDKRRVTENAEILSLFQDSGTYHPEKAPVDSSSFDDLDRHALDEYYLKLANRDLQSFGSNQQTVLRNSGILCADGRLTLAGVLFFARQPQQFCPSFVIKAVSFFGNSLAGTEYRSSKDITGTIPEMFEQGMNFLKSNLNSIQDGQSFNSLGKLEIPEAVLEDMLQNSLVHRDYLRTAPIRILIFDNRVEIISPGSLAGGLTIDDIKMGQTFQRNPQIGQFCTYTTQYRGLGSGVMRALSICPNIQMVNNDSGKQFSIIIPRVGGLIETQGDTVNDIENRVENRNDTVNDTVNGVENRKCTEKCTENGAEKPNDIENDIENGVENKKCTEKCTENLDQMLKKCIERSKVIGERLTKTKYEILRMMLADSTITRGEMAEQLNMSSSGISKNLEDMRDKFIRRVGPDRGGHWEVIIE